MRCDLHVHSRFSGRCTVPVLRHFVDESYSEPGEVYARARRRGMDLVTLTDHDTIEGALALAGRPDTFVSEEVTCGLPGGRQLHLGVYDLTAGQHEGIASRRDDAERLFAYLAEQRLPVSLNHPFSALTGDRRTHDLDVAFARFDLVEGRNSMLPPVTNRAASEAALSRGLSVVGGSDSHTLNSVARAYTVVPGARTRGEFLAGLRHGYTLPAGDSGTYARFAGDLVRIAGNAYREAFARMNAPLATAAMLVASAPLLPLLPLVAAGLYLHERSFAARHFQKFRDGGDVPRRPRTLSGTLQAAPSGA